MEILKRFKTGNSSLQGLQLDLEAQIGAIEIEDVSNSVSILSNRIDECLHLMSEVEGNALALELVEVLTRDLSEILEKE